MTEPDIPEGLPVRWHDQWRRQAQQDPPPSAPDVAAPVFTYDELSGLLDSWLLSLRARNKSKETVGSYEQGVKQFLAWARKNDRPAALNSRTVDEFLVYLKDLGRASTTLVARQLSLRQFSKWLKDEGEIREDLLVGLTAPKIDVNPLRPLSDEELTALFKACRGPEFIDKRDEALARFMAETFARANDALSMTTADTDIKLGEAILIGKGHKPRVVGFGPQTAVSLDRYVRVRRTHRLASTPAFWLGGMGKSFGYDALYHALTSRAEVAGIEGFHPHRLRATGATRWLINGGSEGGARSAGGWKDGRMLQRYTEYTSQVRAAAEGRNLNLGDL
jgi:integrase/recombinase XerD